MKTTTKTSQVGLDLWKAEWLLKGALAATPKDGPESVLEAVQVVIEDKHVRATATDRYRIHSLIAPRVSAKVGEDRDVLISRAAAKFVVTSAAKFRRGVSPTVEIAWDDESVTVTIAGARDSETNRIGPRAAQVTWREERKTGTYPPVVRALIVPAREVRDSGTPAPLAQIGLNMRLLGETSVLSPDGTPGELTAIPGYEGASKPGPLLVSFGEPGSYVAEALIQPQLRFHRAEGK